MNRESPAPTTKTPAPTSPAGLDGLGIHYIVGGWPGSNPKDIQFFKGIRSTPLSQARIAAFGSTCRAGTPPQQDPNIQALIEAGTEVVTIFGKSWDIHPVEALTITLDQNLEIIQSSIQFLKDRVGEVIFDAEHFFDGYKSNPQYALSHAEGSSGSQGGTLDRLMRYQWRDDAG